MQKYGAILLTTLMLATSSPTHQVVRAIIKAGAFFHHFLHHRHFHEEQVGIAGFVELHYSDHTHQEADQTKHKNLPFRQDQHNQQNIVQPTLFLMAEPHQIESFPKLEITSNPLISHPQQWLSLVIVGDIWQPPKA